MLPQILTSLGSPWVLPVWGRGRNYRLKRPGRKSSMPETPEKEKKKACLIIVLIMVGEGGGGRRRNSFKLSMKLNVL